MISSPTNLGFELIDERLTRDSLLQELTIAAMELFDPRKPMDAFMDRLAMRLGCVAVLSVNFRGEDAQLLSASGLSGASRKLPLPTTSEFKEGNYPWPEVRRADLVFWDIEVSALEQREDDGKVHVLFFIPKSANVSVRYRRLVERICRVVCLAINHRQLYAKVLRSEQELFEKKNLFQCISDGSIEGMMFLPNSGSPMCNDRFLSILELPPLPESVTHIIERIESLAEQTCGLTERMAHLTILTKATSRARQSESLTSHEQGIELKFCDGREFLFFCLPVCSPEGRRFGTCWYLRDVTTHKRAERVRTQLLDQERQARALSEQAQRRFSFMAEAGQILVSSLDLHLLLENIIRHCIPTLADACSIELSNTQDFERHVVTAHVGPTAGDPLCWLDSSNIPENFDVPLMPDSMIVMGLDETDPRRTHEIHALVKRNTKQLMYLLKQDFSSALHAPLIARDRCIGVLSLVTTCSGRSYGDSERLLIEDLATRIALAMDNASLFRRLEKALQVRDDFLSVASHELRTPMTSFRLAVQGLRRMAARSGLKEKTDPMMLEALDTALRQSERLERFVHTLLETSRVGAQRRTPFPENIDLAELIKQIIQDFREEFYTSGSEVHLDLQPICGRWDRWFIEQIFINLLTNALKFGAGKPIEISTISTGGWAHIVVRDHGIGVSKNDQERIFERFERAVSARHYSGFGIGLSLIQELLKAMGGRIRLESELGHGAVFTVELPVERGET